MDTPKDYFTPQEASEYLGTTIPVLDKNRRAGKLPFFYIGNKVMYRKQDLQAFVDSLVVAAGEIRSAKQSANGKMQKAHAARAKQLAQEKARQPGKA